MRLPIYEYPPTVADLNAHLNRGRAEPAKIVGSLHTDNAGEFLSRDFKEFVNSELITQTTCPPYVHSLNGVAERAIRSIMENARTSRQPAQAGRRWQRGLFTCLAPRIRLRTEPARPLLVRVAVHEAAAPTRLRKRCRKKVAYPRRGSNPRPRDDLESLVRKGPALCGGR